MALFFPMPDTPACGTHSIGVDKTDLDPPKAVCAICPIASPRLAPHPSALPASPAPPRRQRFTPLSFSSYFIVVTPRRTIVTKLLVIALSITTTTTTDPLGASSIPHLFRPVAHDRPCAPCFESSVTLCPPPPPLTFRSMVTP